MLKNMNNSLHNIGKQNVHNQEKILDTLPTDKNVTEEEFQNFVQRATEVEKVVKMLASSDVNEQQQGQILADQILQKDEEKNIAEDVELIIKSNRTVVNKLVESEIHLSPDKMSQEMFMRTVEKDAKDRAENRKIRNERAETFKRIGNGAFKDGDYAKAITYYSKGIEQRKDSSVLWNNRALSYMQLGLYQKALSDCEWALKVNNSNIKALLNSAKCWKQLNNEEKYNELIRLAKERNPSLIKFINEFERELGAKDDSSVTQLTSEDCENNIQ